MEMIDQNIVQNVKSYDDISFIFRSPRGKMTNAPVSSQASYEKFLSILLGQASVIDLKHSQQSRQEKNYRKNLINSNNYHVGNAKHENRDLNEEKHTCSREKTPLADSRRIHVQEGNMLQEDVSWRRLESDEIFTNNASQNENLTPSKASRLAYVSHNGKILGPSEYYSLAEPSNRNKTSTKEYYISLHLRVLGGMTDRQNRVGSKFGGGGQSSSQQGERERKERLRQLALETVDLAKDPYLMRNHLGTYECKLCLTLHTNEGNYLAHTQGKKHQAGLAKRAAMEAKMKGTKDGIGPSLPALSQSSAFGKSRAPRVKIGRPGYEISKSRDPETQQRCLSFTLHFPDLSNNVQPRHRFMSCYEQRIESPPDRRYQYLLVAAEPYETVAFKIPNERIDRGEGRFVSYWDEEGKKFTLTCYFVDEQDEKKEQLS